MSNLHDAKSVDLSRLADEVSDILAIVENLAINPTMSVVLPGTHTAAIRRISTSNTTRNIETVGWQMKTSDGGSYPTLVDCAGDADNQKLTVTIVVSGGGDIVRIRQVLGSTVGGIDQYTDDIARSLQGRTVNFAIDVETDTARAAGSRAYIYTNGTGGTTTYGDYHGNNTDTERLTVAAVVPSDATEVHFGVCLEIYGTTKYTLRKATAVAADSTLSEVGLAFQPTAKKRLCSSARDGTYQLVFVAPDTSWRQSGIGASGVSPDFDFNANRPAWATAVESFICAYNGSGSDQSVKYAPAGFTNETLTAEAYLVNYNNGVIQLGADGQIEIKGSAAALVSWLKVIRWIGEGL